MKNNQNDIGYISHIGNVRGINQDSMIIRGGNIGKEKFYLLAVADGMGGMEKGEFASNFIIEKLNDWWNKTLEKIITKENKMDLIFAGILDTVNYYSEEFLKIRSFHKNLAATTITVMFIYQNKYMLFHMGDSRAYKLSEKQTVQLTKDHNWYNFQLEKGILSVEEIEKYPKKHALVNAFGVQGFFVQTEIGKIDFNECVLLCTDGFYKYISIDKLFCLTDKKSCQQILDIALNDILNGRATDNITAVLFKRS